MKKLPYNIVNDSISVWTMDGKLLTFHRSLDNDMFEEITNCLINEDFDTALDLMDLESKLEKYGIYKNHANQTLMMKDTVLPDILVEILFKAFLKKETGTIENISKFFLNLIYDSDYTKDKEVKKIIKELFKVEGYNFDDKGQIRIIANKNPYKNIPFYSYLNNSFAYLFKNKMRLDEIANKVFNKPSKRMKKLIRKELFNNDNLDSNIVNTAILTYGRTFKDIISENNFYKIWEEQSIPLDPYNVIYWDTFRGIIKNFNEKKIMNIIKQLKDYTLEDFTDLMIKYSEITQALNNFEYDLDNMRNFSQLIINTHKKIDSGYIEFDSFLHYPEAHNIRNQKVKNSNLMAIIPQNSYELTEWGTAMHNCIGGYGSIARRGESLLIGFIYSNDKEYNPSDVYYTLEIQNRKIRQFEFRNRAVIDSEIRNRISNFLRENNIID